MAISRVAVVSGANRGIGFEIARQLGRLGLHVVLGARHASSGKQAEDSLRAEGLSAEWALLDVTDTDGVARLARDIQAQHRRCDVLVNNAGVLLDPRGSSILTADLDTFARTLETNFYGPLRLCQALVPLMRANRYGRVVNVSSGLGQLHEMRDGTPAYRVSKTALNALTRMLASATHSHGILVNAMCPGWVRTDLGGPDATRSVEQGADTAVWLATLPDDGPTGGLFRDRTPIPW
ncbi:MAG TPA: SDR family oxidoreductase [Burkholderiales bacterium]|nr:SDR family oxidoreductase [Burkholderiales bacterium]